MKTIITLLGLFFSILVFNAMMWLMAQTIFPAMAAATAESLFGVVSTVVMIVFISVLNYQIASRSFLLINQIPDRVTRWFGAADHSDESHHVNAIIGAVSGGASKAIEAGGGAYRGTFMTKPGAKAGGGEKTSGGKTDNTNTHSDVEDTGEVNVEDKTSEEKGDTSTIT